MSQTVSVYGSTVLQFTKSYYEDYVTATTLCSRLKKWGDETISQKVSCFNYCIYNFPQNFDP